MCICMCTCVFLHVSVSMCACLLACACPNSGVSHNNEKQVETLYLQVSFLVLHVDMIRDVQEKFAFLTLIWVIYNLT